MRAKTNFRDRPVALDCNTVAYLFLTKRISSRTVTFVNNIFKLKRYFVRWTASSLSAQNKCYTHREFHFLKNTRPLLRERYFSPFLPVLLSPINLPHPPQDTPTWQRKFYRTICPILPWYVLLPGNTHFKLPFQTCSLYRTT